MYLFRTIQYLNVHLCCNHFAWSLCPAPLHSVHLLAKYYANTLHSFTDLDHHYGLNSCTKPVARITTVPSVFWTDVPGSLCTSVYVHIYLAASRSGLHTFISSILVIFCSFRYSADIHLSNFVFNVFISYILIIFKPVTTAVLLISRFFFFIPLLVFYTRVTDKRTTEFTR
jgi:hypothetical protein